MKILRSTRGYALCIAALLIIFLVACGGEAGPDPTTPIPTPEPQPTPDDTYADPETPPPEPITDPTVMTSGALAVSDAARSLVTLNVTGFSAASAELNANSLALNSSLGAASAALSDEDFTLVEAGKVQGIKVDRIEAGDKAPADIAFVIDTTSSMGEALSSVKETLIDFSKVLENEGLDIRLGAVTFGDAFDTQEANSRRSGTSLMDKKPPSFDQEPRPSFALTSDFAAFQTFITEESPRGGGDTPENILGALSFAYEFLVWREGAQRILIIVTDTCSHTEVSNFFIDDPWAPSSFEKVLSEVRARATVHVVGGGDCRKFGGTLDMQAFAGAKGTGGLYYAWGGGPFNLVDIGLTQTTANDYLITYQGELNGKEKDVRLVIDNGDAVRGEFTLKVTY